MTAEWHGDYALRGKGAEDRLIGPIDDRIIDTDALVRRRCGTGSIPTWDLYRAGICGDTHVVPRLKLWAVGFASAYAEAGGVRADARSEALYGVAGLDALYRVLYGVEACDDPRGGFAVSAAEGGRLCGTTDKTYARLRMTLFRVWRASLHDYFAEMVVAYASLASQYRGAGA